MSTLTYVAADSSAMVRRNLLHMIRYPALSLFVIATPIVFLLLFVYVFGGTLGAGLPAGGASGRGAYLAYVVPGIVLVSIAGGAAGTATTVAMDMTEGIIARFRTMAISRTAVLTGHVLGNVLQGIIGAALVLAVAVVIGFRPTAGPAQWAALVGIIALILFAITWLAVGMGMAATSVESASNMPTMLLLLPFLGSGFVPTDTMPTALRVFAEYQPFTPFIETTRGLLLGTPIGNSAVLSIGWCLIIALIGWTWSRTLYNRKSIK